MLTDLRRTALLEVVQKGEAHCSQVYSARKEEALNEIQLILGQFPVVAFVRDQSATPHCKGSEVLLGHLLQMKIKFKQVNLTEIAHLIEWLQVYSGHYHFPQLYVNKKFVGTLEIVVDLIKGEQFLSLIPVQCIKTNAMDRINMALKKSTVMVFMKGTP